MRNFKIGTAAVLVLPTVAVVLAACQQANIAPPVTSADDRVAPAVSVKKVLAVYEGVLPCADCQGIRTELTLFDDDSSYKLVETYLGTPDGDRTVESDGTWTLQRPRKDPEATIYQLHPGKPGEARSFLIVDERQIRQLDREGREIESLGYTLTRKESPAAH
jgi:copper homeostasis protein (lipoprotein)